MKIIPNPTTWLPLLIFVFIEFKSFNFSLFVCIYAHTYIMQMFVHIVSYFIKLGSLQGSFVICFFPLNMIAAYSQAITYSLETHFF